MDGIKNTQIKIVINKIKKVKLLKNLKIRKHLEKNYYKKITN